MEIEAKKDYEWSVDYKVRCFKKGETCDLPEALAMNMVNAGYSRLYSSCEQKSSEAKAIEVSIETPETGPEENKAIESAEENKEAPKKSKCKKK